MPAAVVPAVLATHCERVPDALLSDATFCGPISMLAFAVLAYAVYMISPVVLEAISIVKEIVALFRIDEKLESKHRCT